MKNSTKIILIVALIVVVTASVFMVTACNDKNEKVAKIVSIVATVDSEATFTVGSAFDTSKITVTATLDNKTKADVSTTAAIEYDYTVLNLDSEGKFTRAGTYELPVSYSDWSTKVTITVTEA